MMNAKKFRYSRSDFKPLPVKLEHMDICLNFLDGKVEGTNTLRITAREALDSVTLDARDIEIRSVERAGDVSSQSIGGTVGRLCLPAVALAKAGESARRFAEPAYKDPIENDGIKRS